MMRQFSDAAGPRSICTTTIAAIVALVLVVACGTGIAAFSGLLPESDNVAVTVTSTPLIDIWRNESSSPKGVDSEKHMPESAVE